VSKQNNSSLPNNWATIPLKDITLKIVDGSHNPPRKQDNGMPMLSARNINNNQINFDIYRLISEKDFEHEHNRTRITPGDVLLTIVGTIGRSAIVPDGIKPFTLQRSVAVLTLKNIVPKYLMYQLQAPFFQRHLKKVAKGTAQKGVYLRTLGQSTVRVAPLNEQKRIVAEIEKQFSRLDEGVENLKRVKVNLKRYKASVLKAAVEGKLTEDWRAKHPDVEPADKLLGRILAERRKKWEEAELAKMRARGKKPKDDKWKKKYKEPYKPDLSDLPKVPTIWKWGTFDQVSTRVTVGHVGPMKNEYKDSGIPFLRSQNVRENKFSPIGLKYINRSFHKKLQKSSLQPGDIVVVRSGSVGITCVIPSTLSESNCSDLVIIKQPFAVLPEYGSYYMNSITKTRVASEKVGVALTHFNTKSVAAMPIPVPPLDEQVRIVADVEKRLSIIDGIEIEVEQNLFRSDRLRQSILKKAFSGKLLKDDIE
jgi:type I restriction enzyme S subunit